MEHFVGGSSGLASVNDSEEGSFTMDVFKKCKTSDEILNCQFVELTPQEALHSDIPAITFHLPQTHLPVYTDLREIYISLHLAISKVDTTTGKRSPVTYNDNVVPCNRICDTLFNKESNFYKACFSGGSHKPDIVTFFCRLRSG